MHIEQRLKERAGIHNFDFQEIVDLALVFGEHICYNKRGDIYRCKYQNKTIYPVIAFDGTLVTVLAEDMVRRIKEESR